MVLSIAFFIFGILYFVILICSYANIKIAVHIVDAVADFIYHAKNVIFVPFCFFFVAIFGSIFWIVSMGSMNSLGTITADPSGGPQFKKVEHTAGQEALLYWMNMVMLFGIFWIWSFVSDLTGFVSMVAAATYYFDSNAQKDGHADIKLGLYFVYKYHLGSIAFGSIVIPLIALLKMLIVWPCQQVVMSDSTSKLHKINVICGELCLKFFEKLTDYLNDQAYSYLAIHGQSFCKSAWHGFLLNMKHANHFSDASTVTATFIFIAKMGCVAFNCYSLYMIMKYVFKDIEEVSSLSGPFFVVGFFTYMCATMLLGLFDEIILALLTSLSVDCEAHNKHPKFGPPQFHKLIDKFFEIGMDEEDIDALLDEEMKQEAEESKIGTATEDPFASPKGEYWSPNDFKQDPNKNASEMTPVVENKKALKKFPDLK